MPAENLVQRYTELRWEIDEVIAARLRVLESAMSELFAPLFRPFVTPKGSFTIKCGRLVLTASRESATISTIPDKRGRVRNAEMRLSVSGMNHAYKAGTRGFIAAAFTMETPADLADMIRWIDCIIVRVLKLREQYRQKAERIIRRQEKHLELLEAEIAAHKLQ